MTGQNLWCLGLGEEFSDMMMPKHTPKMIK